MEGKIVVFTGPMSSGKTTALLNTIQRYKIREIPTLVIKPKIDNRFASDKVLTHDKKLEVSCVNASCAAEILQLSEDFNVIGIDEAMMFDSELVKVCQHLRAIGKTVYLSTLDMDFRMEPFQFTDRKSSIGDLLAIANEVKKFQAVCTQRNHQGIINGTDAHYTSRISDSDDLLQVGGLESYNPVSLDFHPRIQHFRDLY